MCFWPEPPNHQSAKVFYVHTDMVEGPSVLILCTVLTPGAWLHKGDVAASDVGGHRELIEDQVTGTLFAADNPAACAQALARQLDQREGWDAMREAGVAHVKERHDWARNAQIYDSVYQRLLGQTKNLRAPREAA